MPPAAPRQRGSVLIFVVGVLMLLAIVATAFLSASRRERVEVQQYSVNTQADLMLEGVVNAAEAQIAASRSALGSMPLDDWLASRVPTTLDPNEVYSGNATNDAGANLACWPIISAPPLGNRCFESPVAWPGMTTGFSSRDHVFPTFKQFAGQQWPALRVGMTGADGVRQDETFLAADADGDGIADAGLFRIPVGNLAGVTYYGAIRIIDNNAAINLNTALSRDDDFLGDGSAVATADNPIAGAFTANVGLAELLRTPSAELSALNQYRWNLPGSSASPSGIIGADSGNNFVFDDTPMQGGVIGPRADPSGQLPEFQFASVGDFLQAQISSRIARPGVTGTMGGATHGRAIFPDGLPLASRFCLAWPEEIGSSANRMIAALLPSVHFGPAAGASSLQTPVPTRPYTGRSDGDGINAWFTTNFDYASENPADPKTWMSRRTLLTDTNGVNMLSTAPALPPAYLYSATDPQWATRRPAAYPPVYTPVGGTSPIPTLPMTAPSPLAVDAKASVNTARFEELFYAYFKVMAQSGFDGQANDKGTPFSLLYNGNTDSRTGTPAGGSAVAARAGCAFNPADGIYTGSGDQYYDDPYIGTRFTRATPAAPLSVPDRTEPPGLASVINGQSSNVAALVVEQHPLRMFRSPLRPPPPRSVTGAPPATAIWDRNTPRLSADQVLILRAALAAANLEALRDSSHNPLYRDPVHNSNIGGGNERTTVHRIPLTAYINNVATPVVANVFGLRRQPYIAEIYANTLAGVDGAAAPAPPALVRPNPKGYVAIKLYNPTAVPISLQYCRLVGLHRVRDAAGQYPGMTVRPLSALASTNAANTDQIDLGNAAITSNVLGSLYPANVIPAHGTLVLENIPGSGQPLAATAAEDATYRPTSTGLLSANDDNTGLITPADFATQNFAYVPGLSRVVWDRDLVLMRPANCRPPSATGTPPNTLVYIPADPDAPASPGIAGMAPLDSYDFTGLAPLNDTSYTPTRTRAEIWHYVRTVAPAGATSGGWQWVYPGRYDADQSIPAIAGELPAPRQQGTYRAIGSDGAFGWNPQLTSDKDPLAERPSAGVVVSLATPIASGTVATYPDVFTIRLNPAGWSSDTQLHDYTAPGANGQTEPNRYPFGGLCRLADLLRAPFIGSYTLQTEADAAAGDDTYLEITPVTMDAVFAEDTDPADNERPTDNGTQSREQIGRFVPLRPSIGGSTGSFTNGAPAKETFKPNADANLPPTIRPENDPAFDTTNPAGLDPFRYSDDASPSGKNAATDAIDARINRYAFAHALFDHFAIFDPSDDYVPNYPTQPQWQPATAYSVGDMVQYGQHLFVCKTAHISGNNAAASRGSPDWLDPGTAAHPPGQPDPTPPVAFINWLPLPRYPLVNGKGPAGCRSDIWTDGNGNPRPFDDLTSNDNEEMNQSVPGLININTAPEKVLAMLPWSVRQSNDVNTDRLTFNFNTYPPTAIFGGDGMDDNAQIAHAIVLYRDGRYASANSSAANALNISAAAQTWAAAASPFGSLFDLYCVPGIRAAQAATLTQATQDPGTQDHVRHDFEAQTLLLNRVSSLITTRSDSFTLYALVQGWQNAGTDRARLVVQRRAALLIDRSAALQGQCVVKSITRIPVQ